MRAYGITPEAGALWALHTEIDTDAFGNEYINAVEMHHPTIHLHLCNQSSVGFGR
jgi:hypothetical protein